jgi:protein involved in polysaccharide export with SLBB domain
MFRYFSWAIAVVIGLQVAGCYTDFGPVAPAANPVDRPFVATRLQPGDRIKVTVYGEETLNGVYDVDPSGYVSLPLAGNVKAAGRTTAELQDAITAQYQGQYLQNPQVTVDIVAFRPISIIGQVGHPGEIPYRAGLDVVSAIATAGGLTYRGSRSTVLIKHDGDQVWREYSMVPTVMVSPGDIVRVPERYF